MDQNLALLSTGTGGTIFAVLLFLYKTCNHKRLRSKCCGVPIDFSVDVENTTPPPENFSVNNPTRQPQIVVPPS
jgi:hypothetical protein